ncbi:MAG: hypothetical protein AB2805_11075 [Candidatus Thiodiazotropha sp.]
MDHCLFNRWQCNKKALSQLLHQSVYSEGNDHKTTNIFCFSSLVAFVITMEASAVIEADAFETLSAVHPIRSQIVDNRMTSAPLRLAGKTKTTTSSSDNSDDNSNQSDSSGGYIGASYEGE